MWSRYRRVHDKDCVIHYKVSDCQCTLNAKNRLGKDESCNNNFCHFDLKLQYEELAKYQVILATCSAAGSQRIKRSANVIQCIVDEAGMCSEPETLIPLVSTTPLQIVLIGDHKQLR